MSDQAKLPRYKCHKEVHALQIKEVVEPQDGGAFLVPVDKGYGSVTVSAEYMDKHKPVPGGYYVVYADGYQSFSPRVAFEQGYRRVR